MQGTWRWTNGFIVVLVRLAAFYGAVGIISDLACRAIAPSICFALFFLTHEVLAFQPGASQKHWVLFFVFALRPFRLGFVFRFRSPPISHYFS